MEFTLIQKIVIWIIPIIFAVTLHEASHGYVAYKLGDDTAYRLGRVTANPLKHIDLIGTIILPILLMMTAGFIFGWAKPVPVLPHRLKHPKRDFAIVALAGPLSNLLMAIFWALLLKLSISLQQNHILAGIPLSYMSNTGVLINLVLMVLNLIPIPPLDGSRVVHYLLPPPWDQRFDKLTPFGILIILLLIISGVLIYIMYPIITFLTHFLYFIFQIR